MGHSSKTTKHNDNNNKTALLRDCGTTSVVQTAPPLLPYPSRRRIQVGQKHKRTIILARLAAMRASRSCSSAVDISERAESNLCEVPSWCSQHSVRARLVQSLRSYMQRPVLGEVNDGCAAVGP